MWKISWHLPLKGRVKNFIWRCWNNYLGSKDNLARRRILSDTTCEVCGEATEIVAHILFHCPRAVICWKLSGLLWDSLQQEDVTFQSWWMELCKIKEDHFRTERMSISALLIWNIWKSINEWIWNRTHREAKEIVEKTLSDWLEIVNIKEGKAQTVRLNLSAKHHFKDQFSKKVGQESSTASALGSLEGCLEDQFREEENSGTLAFDLG
ncbi:Unknown protein [Striga hermonthica]|uniref:Reverse transcriptase zinc-binding domain-containing protein n=1 Tax=Striga hermonthica TaxID=68872 RepID=A0A9N7NL50_STRHE|nr:Unknown protein [Striga hermonthica]